MSQNEAVTVGMWDMKVMGFIIVQLYVLSDVHNQVSFVLATKLMNVVGVPWPIASQAHAYFLVIFVSYCLQ